MLVCTSLAMQTTMRFCNTFFQLISLDSAINYAINYAIIFAFFTMRLEMDGQTNGWTMLLSYSDRIDAAEDAFPTCLSIYKSITEEPTDQYTLL